MKKPKITIIHYSIPPVIGGVEFVIEAHAKLLADKGYYTKILAGRGKSFDPRVKLRIIPEINSLSDWSAPKGKEKKWKMLAQKIHNKLALELKGIDICIIHNCMTMPFNMPLVIALHKIIEERKETKFIAWCHDSVFLDKTYKPFLSSIKENSFPWILLRKPLKNVQYVTISANRAEGFARLFRRKITIVPNGIGLDFLNLSQKALFIFGKFDLAGTDLVALLPIRIIKRKNVEMAATIIKELNKKINAKTIITGPPDPHKKGDTYFRSLKKLVKKLKISKKIIFLCDLKYEGKRIKVGFSLLKDLYRLADILLLPSYKEGFGIPILEAGLSKLPVFSSSIAPIKEVGKKDVNYFYLNEKPEKIAKRILRFYQKNKSLNLFKRVLRSYTWQTIFKKKIEPLLRIK